MWLPLSCVVTPECIKCIAMAMTFVQMWKSLRLFFFLFSFFFSSYLFVTRFQLKNIQSHRIALNVICLMSHRYRITLVNGDSDYENLIHKRLSVIWISTKYSNFYDIWISSSDSSIRQYYNNGKIKGKHTKEMPRKLHSLPLMHFILCKCVSL